MREKRDTGHDLKGKASLRSEGWKVWRDKEPTETVSELSSQAEAEQTWPDNLSSPQEYRIISKLREPTLKISNPSSQAEAVIQNNMTVIEFSNQAEAEAVSKPLVERVVSNNSKPLVERMMSEESITMERTSIMPTQARTEAEDVSKYYCTSHLGTIHI